MSWNKNEEPGLLTRIGSYAAIVLACAVLSGAAFWFWPVLRQLDAETPRERARAREALLADTPERSRARFWIGAAVGGIAGAGFIVRYHLKHGADHLR